MSLNKTHHLDSPQRIATVIEEIASLPAVDTHDSKKQRTAGAQRNWNARLYDLADAVFELALQDLVLGEPLLHVGSQPYSGQRRGVLQQLVWIEHGDGG